jgi:hypothetical protein
MIDGDLIQTFFDLTPEAQAQILAQMGSDKDRVTKMIEDLSRIY